MLHPKPRDGEARMILGLTAFLAAQAPNHERWACVYSGYGDGKPISVIMELRGKELTDVDFGVSYHVVFDDGRALIAVYPAVGPTGGKYTINSRTMVIDRETGRMIVANADLGGSAADNSPTSGQCGKAGL